MEPPHDTHVYADGATASVYWLKGEAVIRCPILAERFDGDGDEPPFGNGMPNDLAAHIKRIQAALHRAEGRNDRAENAEREARFYDICADNSEAACLPGCERALNGVRPVIDEPRIVRMTVDPGENRVPVLTAG